MKIYEVRPDTNNVQWVMPRVLGEAILDVLSFDCVKRNDELNNIRWFIYDPKTPKKNFYTGINGALVFDQSVYDSELLTILEIAGEILPLNMETGEKLYLLNILDCINVLDHDRSIRELYSDGTKGRVLQYAFHEDYLSESSLFKIPETSKVEILTYSGVKGNSLDEFYTLYKELGFTGLVFKELYPLHA